MTKNESTENEGVVLPVVASTRPTATVVLNDPSTGKDGGITHASSSTTLDSDGGRGDHQEASTPEDGDDNDDATVLPVNRPSIRQVPIHDNTEEAVSLSSSSSLRKRDSSSNLKSMGGSEQNHTTDRNMIPILFDSDNWSKLMGTDKDDGEKNKSNNEGSSHSNTSATLSESEEFGENFGKKSRSSSPERSSRTYDKSHSSTSLGSSTTTSDAPNTMSSSLSLSAIRPPTDVSSTIHRSPSMPLLLLPSPDCGNDMDPDDFLLQLITALYPNVKLQVKSALKLESYFPTISEEQMAGYNTELVQIARSNDVTALQEYYKTHGRESLNCFNRFGEGLLNMACRRGFTDMVQFLLSAGIHLPVRVRDDGGRTPLHDACWYPEPQLDVCTMIIQQDPSLLLVADKRGYTPFQYARKSDWLVWRKFLVQNLDQVRILGSDPDIIARFS